MLASRVTTAGFSAGGYLAAQFASYDALFRSALILHSSVRGEHRALSAMTHGAPCHVHSRDFAIQRCNSIPVPEHCTPICRHFKSACSQVDPSQLYSYVFPIWMSTGTSDPAFSVNYDEDIASDLRLFGYNVTFRKYSGAHSLGNQQELAAAVQWWLGGAH